MLLLKASFLFLSLYLPSQVYARLPRTIRALLPPQSDPFYQPPEGWQSAAPGTVFKSRQVQASLFSTFPINIEAWQLLFRSEGATNEPLAAASTVLIPQNALKDTLVFFGTAEDSNTLDCAPSYQLQTGSDASKSAPSQVEVLILEAVLARGWITVVPDHEGPSSAFAAGRVSGKITLDSLRSALSFPQFNFTKNAQVTGFGYSGGSLAAGWAAALHRDYASELNIVGIAHGGTVANVSGTVEFLDGTLFAGFGVAGVQGLIDAYPSQLEPVKEQLATQAGLDALSYASTHCGFQDVFQFAGQRFLSEKYIKIGKGLLTYPPVKAVTDQNILGSKSNEVPQIPLLVYHSGADEVVPVKDVDTMVAAYCANGATLEYLREDSIEGHIAFEITSFPNAINWIGDRIAGKPVQKGCHRTDTLLTLLDLRNIGELLATVVGDLLTVLGAKVGPTDNILKDQISREARARGVMA